MLNKNDTLILIGDSITENGRFEDPQEIGIGYAAIIHDFLTVKHPELNLTVLNKGIGGNRVTDLEARWQQDVIELEPDWVSISIGINDVWRQFDQPEMEQVHPELFEEVYDRLLKQVVDRTDAGIILMEPTIIQEQTDSKENLTLKPYIEATNKLASKYQAILVPTHQAFQNYLEAGSKVPLTTDGVHMNSKGDILMASTWLHSFYKS
ncbi:SGNH/GDSL hydrolase family protein [Alkalicoccobacillus plakortidis]|uniref:SGNH/GDSL hydrolase family protein n=1 Tax=Alkalicoccobacillus plakortidis TaxID=444060 RepID=A0ABT0XJV0_9BACI|nr:SGNH/GDSL hydrolase family protein [Alkalicoccobacillus plakortidis]MCM2676175.1 SGNH/GDSL hydrolase family protein [Alkalicoccobacillus plakortidis]